MVDALWTRSPSSDHGRFLSRPPSKRTIGSWKERMAAMVRSGAVAIESLYQLAPFQFRTNSRRCGTPWNSWTAPSMASRGRPAARPMAKAARVFIRLCWPRSWILPCSSSAMSRPRSCRYNRPSWSEAAILSVCDRTHPERNQTTAHHLAQRPGTGIFPASTARSCGPWNSRMRRLAAV